MERDPEDVLAVGGEGVDHRDSTTRPVRGTVDLLTLRHPAGDLVGGLDRAGRRVANRQPADVAGRAQIPVHQCRGEQLDVGDVVEVGALGVEWQVVAGVHVEREQIADRALVFGAVETLKAPATRIGVGGRRRVEAHLQSGGETGEGCLGWATDAGRRHHAGPQLADHLLGKRGVHVGRGNLEPLERHVAVACPVVVAALTRALDDRLGRLGRARSLRVYRRPTGRGKTQTDRDRAQGQRPQLQHRRLQDTHLQAIQQDVV